MIWPFSCALPQRGRYSALLHTSSNPALVSHEEESDETPTSSPSTSRRACEYCHLLHLWAHRRRAFGCPCDACQPKDVKSYCSVGEVSAGAAASALRDLRLQCSTQVRCFQHRNVRLLKPAAVAAEAYPIHSFARVRSDPLASTASVRQHCGCASIEHKRTPTGCPFPAPHSRRTPAR